MRHLLHHSGGFLMGYIQEYPEMSNTEYLNWALVADGSLRVQQDPGTVHIYSDFGFFLLGRVVKVVAGTQYNVRQLCLLRSVRSNGCEWVLDSRPSARGTAAKRSGVIQLCSATHSTLHLCPKHAAVGRSRRVHIRSSRSAPLSYRYRDISFACFTSAYADAQPNLSGARTLLVCREPLSGWSGVLPSGLDVPGLADTCSALRKEGTCTRMRSRWVTSVQIQSDALRGHSLASSPSVVTRS